MTTDTTRIFDGVSAEYDDFRLPTPRFVPETLVGVLGRRPKCVVDLGSGTGLSTFVWKGETDHIIGVEPNEEMREEAEKHIEEQRNIEFRSGDSESTGLPDSSVDIVASTAR